MEKRGDRPDPELEELLDVWFRALRGRDQDELDAASAALGAYLERRSREKEPDEPA